MDGPAGRAVEPATDGQHRMGRRAGGRTRLHSHACIHAARKSTKTFLCAGGPRATSFLALTGRQWGTSCSWTRRRAPAGWPLEPPTEAGSPGIAVLLLFRRRRRRRRRPRWCTKEADSDLAHELVAAVFSFFFAFKSAAAAAAAAEFLRSPINEIAARVASSQTTSSPLDVCPSSAPVASHNHDLRRRPSREGDADWSPARSAGRSGRPRMLRGGPTERRGRLLLPPG